MDIYMSAGLRNFDPTHYAADAEKLLDEVAQAIQKDYEKTTGTWTNKPKFKIHKKTALRFIGTSDKIYRFVDEGTRGHFIPLRRAKSLVFHSGYKAKSVRRFIGSEHGGSFGPLWGSKGHYVKGIESREFTEAIAESKVDEFMQKVSIVIKPFKK